MTVQVGVTGHRRLGDADAAGLRRQAAAMFRAVGLEAHRLLAVDGGLARPMFQPGPPVLRCVCGLAAGADTVLAEAALEEGWTLVAALPFPRGEFERDFEPAQLERFRWLLERSQVVSELAGDRSRGGEPYAAVGRQIVEQSDMLLAVWDGLPPRGPGGTGDVVEQARAGGVPVAVLAPDGPGGLAWLGVAGPEAAVGLILPPADPDAGGGEVFDAGPPAGRAAGLAVRWFERLMLAGMVRPAVAQVPGRLAGPGVVVAAFEATDRLAGLHAARYRAAGLMRYGLVLPATAGAFVGAFGPPEVRPGGYLLQFAALMAMLWFCARGGWARDQQRFVSCRAVAEYLRVAGMLLPFGAVAQWPWRPGQGTQAADWATWYGKAVVRQGGLPPGCHGCVGGATEMLRSATLAEVAFLSQRAARFGVMASRLRLVGTGLATCGFVLVAVHGAMLLAQAGAGALRLFDTLALVLPAMAPVFLGLLGFGEYGRLAARYEAVAAALRQQLAALDHAPPRREAVLPVARAIADIMLAEGSDWQLLVKARPVSAF